MAFTLGHFAGGVSPLHMRRSAFPAPLLLRLGEALLPFDDTTARALASAGFAGLISLPFLIVSSLVLEAPLAGPAVIALGYLGCAHAIAARDGQRAAGWAMAVFAGLIFWTFAILATAEGRAGWPATIGALLAPLTAAAPALARVVLARADQVRATLADQVACLNRFAPAEAVLFLDRTGAVAAATRAALRRLDLPVAAGRGDVMPRLHILDRPLLLGALSRSRVTGEPVEVGLRLSEGVGTASPIIATIECDVTGAATARLWEAEDSGKGSGQGMGNERQTDTASYTTGTGSSPSCDIAMVIRSAIREIRLQADARGVTTTLDDADNMTVNGEAMACKDMLTALLTAAVGCFAEGGTVSITARRLTHTALLRISVGRTGDRDASAKLRAALAERGLEEAIDRIGGSILVEQADDGARVSIRLALAESRAPGAVPGEIRRRLRCV